MDTKPAEVPKRHPRSVVTFVYFCWLVAFLASLGLICATAWTHAGRGAIGYILGGLAAGSVITAYVCERRVRLAKAILIGFSLSAIAAGAFVLLTVVPTEGVPRAAIYGLVTIGTGAVAGVTVAFIRCFWHRADRPIDRFTTVDIMTAWLGVICLVYAVHYCITVGITEHDSERFLVCFGGIILGVGTFAFVHKRVERRLAGIKRVVPECISRHPILMSTAPLITLASVAHVIVSNAHPDRPLPTSPFTAGVPFILLNTMAAVALLFIHIQSHPEQGDPANPLDEPQGVEDGDGYGTHAD